MLQRLVVWSLVAVVVNLPGSTGPAHAAAVPPAYQVAAGTDFEPAPVRWVVPVRGYRLTGRFGDTSRHWRSVHTGLDLAEPSGTPIRSIGTGVVTRTGYDGRYGERTVVRLSDGTELWYCHQSSITVAVGARVQVGQQIGNVGSTGNVTGPHLHLEIRPRSDGPVDPVTWLWKHGVRV